MTKFQQLLLYTYSYTSSNKYIFMDYYCHVCDKFVKHKSNCKQFKSNIHKEFDKWKNMELTFENPNTDDIDKNFKPTLFNTINNTIFSLSNVTLNYFLLIIKIVPGLNLTCLIIKQ